MDNARYVAHLKIIGKLAYLYDVASASFSDLSDLRATTMDQAATGDAADLPGSDIIARYMPPYDTAINAGPAVLQSLAVTVATAYLRSSYFTSDLDNTPAGATVAAVITAFEADATSDAKTFTTLSATGLINFFDTVKGSATGLAGNGSPSYADATYVTGAIV